MLVDHRTYTVKPGTMARQAALYQEYGLKPQQQMYVVDFTKDRALDGRLVTVRADGQLATINTLLSVTSADPLVAYAQVLQSAARI